MDVLTHIFLPLTLIYILKQEAFRKPFPFIFIPFLLAFLGVFPDLDKLIGVQGLFHSLIFLSLMVIAILLLEKALNSKGTYAGIAAVFVFSHLFLDILDGGPVPFLYPFSRVGIGLEFPMKIAFQSFSFSLQNSPVVLTIGEPRTGFNKFGLINGFGVASIFLFAIVYLHTNLTKKRPKE